MKTSPIVRHLVSYRSINVNVFRALISVVMLLLLTPVTAAPGSALMGGLLNKPASKSGSTQSVLNPVLAIEEINKKLATTSEELAALPSESVSGPLSSGNQELYLRRLYLRQLVFLYQGQLARLPNLQEIQKKRNEMETNAADWSGFSESSPHPFLRADELKETVTILSKKADELEVWLPGLEQAFTLVLNTADKSAVRLRQADEVVEQAKKSSDQQARLNRQRELIALENQVDLARVMGFQIEIQMVREEFLVVQAQLQLARKQLSVASENVELTQQDIDLINQNIELESQSIITELNVVLSSLGLENKTLKQENTAPSAMVKMTQQELEQIHQAQRTNTDIKLQILNRILVYLQMQRDIWNVRLMFAKVTDREKADEAYEKIANNQMVLQTIDEYVHQQRQHILTKITSRSVKELAPTDSESNALRDELRRLDLEQLVSYSRLLGEVEATERLLERSKQELDEKFRVKAVSDYLKEALFTVGNVASEILDFELFAAHDTIEVDGQQISGKRSVTIEKVVKALAILIIGYWFAVRLARLSEAQAVQRLGMDASLARIARRWILFLQVIMLVILSMLVARIPLTIFAFMGGAVAIGAGFGMQNMLKNLISGIMLLFERPFRPGDVVEVGGIRGRVIDIGVRSSQILDGNGIETLIPNSTFIEQNVTNWTLSSKSVRIVVNVGIAYGSPIKEVNRLLLGVAERHGLVLKEPAPVVLLEDFASDALLFGLYVWVEINPDISWKAIASDLRVMISKTLDEHDIVIAFPQRDIHLASSEPLAVRVIPDAQDNTTLNSKVSE